MFIEHIGPLINRSLWSEMLDDRKFYFPITATEPAGAGERPGGIPAMQLRRWRAVGPAEAVTLDKDEPFVGEQSSRIAWTALHRGGSGKRACRWRRAKSTLDMSG